MDVLITGFKGFVGSNLINYLGNKTAYGIDLRTDWLNQINRNDKFSIIHLAGKAHDLKKNSVPEEYYQVNFELTKKLYDAFLKSTANKFIFVSSVKAVADTVDGMLTEDHIPNPITDYGKSKLLAEQYIQSQPLPQGKAYYILRPCMIHGPGNKGNLNLLYQFVQKGVPYPLAAFENKRSFLSVENLSFVISNLLSKEIPSGIYNVSDDKALSTNEVVEILANSLNKRAKLWRVSPSLIRGTAKVGDVLKLPLNTERLNKLTENYIVSNQKLKNTLGVEFPISTAEGLLITAKSFSLQS